MQIWVIQDYYRGVVAVRIEEHEVIGFTREYAERKIIDDPQHNPDEVHDLRVQSARKGNTLDVRVYAPARAIAYVQLTATLFDTE